MQNLLQNFPLAINVRVRVRIKFWQNAHLRAMCVRPKNECANVRACEAKNRRNSQIVPNLFLTNFSFIIQIFFPFSAVPVLQGSQMIREANCSDGVQPAPMHWHSTLIHIENKTLSLLCFVIKTG